MEQKEIVDKTKTELDKLEEYFSSQLKEIRSGRLAVSLVEDIKVDCFGSILPLKQLGAVSAVSQKEILIQLWDKSYVEGAVKAIEHRKIGLGIKVEGANIYLSASPLTEESKKTLIRALNEKKEEVFQGIRRLRDNAWREIQDAFQKKEISEDDKYKAKDKLEDLIKERRSKIEEMVENKEKEINS